MGDDADVRETLREHLVTFLWDHSYKKFRDGYIGEEYDEYPEYLADQLLKEFLDL